MPLVTLACALLAAVHLSIGKMGRLHGVPRNRWLSFCGGIAVTYVFLDVLPEEQDSRFGAFVAGIVFYAVVIFTV